MFAPGDMVECIDDIFSIVEHYWSPATPKRGQQYRVRAIETRGGRGPGLLLEEIVNPEIQVRMRDGGVVLMEPSFRSARFRRLPSIDGLRALLSVERCECENGGAR